MFGNLAMSYNMIDINLYGKVDCSVEQHYHRKFATYQKYRIRLKSSFDNEFEVFVNLIMEENEANNPKYAEVVVSKNCKIKYKNLYNSDPFDKFFKSLDTILNPYYIVEIDSTDIVLTAKVKGKVPSIQTPAVEIYSNNLNIELIDEQKGTDTQIFVSKPNELHLPRTTFGKNYQVPKPGDLVYVIDRVKKDRDRTFIRKITNVKENAKCTCDVLTLNLPIDRLDNNGRINGIGLQTPNAISNNYTASFDSTEIWKRKDNYKEILKNQTNITNTCAIPIGNFMNMKSVVDEIIKAIDRSKFQYFGTKFHWTTYESLLKPFYDKFGNYLREDLFLLTSSANRPDYLIHIDYDNDEPDKPVPGSFTWPALNCTNDTITVWYKCFDGDNEIYTYGKQDVVITDTKLRLKEIDRYFFDSNKFNAAVIKQNDWHTVYNESESTNERMLLQWRFKPTITWSQIQDILQEHNV